MCQHREPHGSRWRVWICFLARSIPRGQTLCDYGNKFINRSKIARRSFKIGGFSTKKDTVNQALLEFIQRRKQQEIIELFGNFPCDEDYDYKKERKEWCTCRYLYLVACFKR